MYLLAGFTTNGTYGEAHIVETLLIHHGDISFEYFSPIHGARKMGWNYIHTSSTLMRGAE
jgi:hypothetical protein